MPISIAYDAGAHLIIVTYQGVLDPEMLSGVIVEAVSLVKQYDCFHILEDFREAEIQFSTTDIYNVPTFLSQELSAFALSGYQFKRALIARKDWKDFSFFETVSVNRAQNVRLFREMEEAKKWLSGR